MYCVANVSVDLTGILYLICGSKILSILISKDQAFSIWLALNKKKYERPLTHDLFVDFLKRYDIKILNATIYREENGIYFAYICTEDFCFDSRPSDAVAIALRLGIPIFVRIDLFKEERCCINYF